MKDIQNFGPYALGFCRKFMEVYLRINTIKSYYSSPHSLSHLTQYLDNDYALVYSEKRIYIRRVLDRKIVAYAKPNDVHTLSRLLGKYLEIKEKDILKEE